LDISEDNYVVADSSKFNNVSLVNIASLDEFSGFVVDDDLPEAYRKYFNMNNIEII